MCKYFRKFLGNLQIFVPVCKNLLVSMCIRMLFPTAYIDAEGRRSLGLMAQFIIDHHIRIVLIAVDVIGKIDHIRGRSAGRTHIDFQTYNLAFFAKVWMVFQQTEKLQMQEASMHFKSLQAGTSAGFQVFGQLIYNIEFN